MSNEYQPFEVALMRDDPDSQNKSKPTLQLSPFYYLDKLILFTPTYVTHNRHIIQNIICLTIIILHHLFFFVQNVYYYIYQSSKKINDSDLKYTFAIKCAIAIAAILNLSGSIAVLLFFSRNLPTIAKNMFNNTHYYSFHDISDSKSENNNNNNNNNYENNNNINDNISNSGSGSGSNNYNTGQVNRVSSHRSMLSVSTIGVVGGGAYGHRRFSSVASKGEAEQKLIQDKTYKFNYILMKRCMLTVIILTIVILLAITVDLYVDMKTHFWKDDIIEILMSIGYVLRIYFQDIPGILMAVISFIILSYSQFKIELFRNKLKNISDNGYKQYGMNAYGNNNDYSSGGIKYSEVEDILEDYNKFSKMLQYNYNSLKYWFLIVFCALIIYLWVLLSLIFLIIHTYSSDDDTDNNNNKYIFDLDDTSTNNFSAVLVDWFTSIILAFVQVLIMLYPAIKIGENFNKLKKLVTNKIEKRLMPLKIEFAINRDTEIINSGLMKNMSREWIIYHRLERLLDTKPLYFNVFGIDIDKNLIVQLSITFVVTRVLSLFWSTLDD